MSGTGSDLVQCRFCHILSATTNQGVGTQALPLGEDLASVTVMSVDREE